MIQFPYIGSKPTLEEVAQRFDIESSLIDHEFDVIETDPDARLCTILVDDSVRIKILDQLGENYENDEIGEFSNPRIEPFGPPED